MPEFRLQNTCPQTNEWHHCGYVHLLCAVYCDNRWMYLVALRLDSIWPIKWKCFSFNTGWLQLFLTSLLLVKYKKYAVLYKWNIFTLFTLVGPSCWFRLESTNKCWMNYLEIWHTFHLMPSFGQTFSFSNTSSLWLNTALEIMNRPLFSSSSFVMHGSAILYFLLKA